MTTIAPERTLAQAKADLDDKIEDGTRCECCGQFAKVYKRKLTTTTAASLIKLYVMCGTDYFHLPRVLVDAGRQQADETKTAYWGLIERRPADDQEHPGKHHGIWRITEKGVDFIHGRLSIPKYALIYNNTVLGFDDADMVDIEDALGTKFNYRELMAGI